MKPLHEIGLTFALIAVVLAFVLAVAGNYLWAVIAFVFGLVVGERCADTILDAEKQRREIDE